MNRIRKLKTSSILLSTLGLFVTLQIATNLIAYDYLKNNVESIKTMDVLNDELSKLNTTVNRLKDTQFAINLAIIDLVSGINDSQKYLISQSETFLQQAQSSFQKFLVIPGIGHQEKELSEKLQQSYQRQYDILNKQLQLLKNTPQVPLLLQQLTTFSDSRIAVRRELRNSILQYLAKLEAEYNKNTQQSIESFTIFSYSAIVITLVLLIITAIIHLWLHTNLTKPLLQIIHHFSLLKSGNLKHALHFNGNREINDLRDSLANMQQGLISTVKTVRDGAESISLGTQEITSGNTDLSSRTEEQAAALTQTAANMEQISTTIRQNAENASEARVMINLTSKKVSDGERLIQDLVSNMQTINNASRQVSEIISTIDAIAFQTNILALNAAVEAARAGEQGRGFSVVAGEVRNLAQRCATSAKEISQLINTAGIAVKEGVTLAAKAGGSMHDIVGAISQVVPMIDNISLASDEQSRGVEQVHLALRQMDEVTQHNASLVEEVATTASNVNQLAQQLVQAVAVFQIDQKQAQHAIANVPSAPALQHADNSQSQWATF